MHIDCNEKWTAFTIEEVMQYMVKRTAFHVRGGLVMEKKSSFISISLCKVVTICIQRRTGNHTTFNQGHPNTEHHRRVGVVWDWQQNGGETPTLKLEETNCVQKTSCGFSFQSGNSLEGVVLIFHFRQWGQSNLSLRGLFPVSTER